MTSEDEEVTIRRLPDESMGKSQISRTSQCSGTEIPPPLELLWLEHSLISTWQVCPPFFPEAGTLFWANHVLNSESSRMSPIDP